MNGEIEMDTTERLESGKSYSLGELFGGGDRKLVIPDLQRDYCWGKDAWIESEKRKADLVSGFIESIVRWSEERPENATPRTMGLVYGYEQPKGRYQICDGQQRLTTLFLLLGVVNGKSGGGFKDFLMSPEERQDDFEPRLLYAIRESTLAFLSDLTKEVFVEDATPLSDALEGISGKGGKCPPPWYFREYDLDPTIQNMIAALRSISRVAAERCADWTEERWRAFGEFLLSDLHFLYYDMGSRSRGEETYIVINTTGEPLTAVENVKPLVLGCIADANERQKYAKEWEAREQWLWADSKKRREFAKEWEAREHWFWRRRGAATTSDEVSRRFLVQYWHLGLLGVGGVRLASNLLELFGRTAPRFEAKDGGEAAVRRWQRFRDPTTIQRYFDAFRRLIAAVAEDNSLREIFQSAATGAKWFDGSVTSFLRGDGQEWQLDMLLPTIAYLEKFPKAARLREFVFRLRKNHFDARRKRNALLPGSESGSHVDWRHVIRLVEESASEDGVFTFDTVAQSGEFPTIEGKALPAWFGTAEKDLLWLQKHGVDIFEWGGHRALMGDLTPLVVRNADGEIDLERTRARWTNLLALDSAVTANPTTPREANVSNWYRLYRVLSGIIKIGHQWQASWGYVGCRFSEAWDCLENDFAFLNTLAFSGLLNADDLLGELKRQCLGFLRAGGLLEVSDSTDADSLLRAFLFAKTLVNEGVAIRSDPDSYPIGIALDAVRNKRNPELAMEWGNLACGKIGRGGWRPTGHAGKEFLDTALDGESIARGGENTPIEKVRATTEAVKALVAGFAAESP